MVCSRIGNLGAEGRGALQSAEDESVLNPFQARQGVWRMRSVRIVVGLVALVCAFGALTGAAYAKAPKEELFFGEIRS